jgi:hypothetical protein
VYRAFQDHKKIALRFSVAGNVARAFSKNPMFSLVGVNYGRKFLACPIAPNCVKNNVPTWARFDPVALSVRRVKA